MSVWKRLRRGFGDESGFGLMELLIVLLITSAMGTILVAMTWQFRPLSEKHEEMEQVAALQAVLRHVVGSLESAELLPLPEQNGRAGSTFIRAGSRSVRFNAVLRQGVLNSGLSDVWIGLARKDGASVLVERLYTRGTGRPSLLQEIVLAEGVGRFDVGMSGESDGRLPGLVTVDIGKGAGDEAISVRGIAVPLGR